MTDQAKLARRLRGRVSTIRGDHAEQLIAYRLKALGLDCISPIRTGWRVHRTYDARTGRSRIMGATPMEKVAADFMAIVPRLGTSVMVECKMRSDDALSLSDFQLHQRNRLTLHAALGGVSLAAWMFEQRVEVLDWVRVAESLVKGKPLHIGDEARIEPMRWAGI